MQLLIITTTTKNKCPINNKNAQRTLKPLTWAGAIATLPQIFLAKILMTFDDKVLKKYINKKKLATRNLNVTGKSETCPKSQM